MIIANYIHRNISELHMHFTDTTKIGDTRRDCLPRERYSLFKVKIDILTILQNDNYKNLSDSCLETFTKYLPKDFC